MEILEKLKADDNLENEIIADLSKEFEVEMKKPADKRDYDKIYSITSAYSELMGLNSEKSDFEQEGIENILSKTIYAENRKKINIFKYKRIISAAACLLVVLGLNTASFRVFGDNVISSAYRITKGGISMIINESEPELEEIILPTTEDDPYGIKAKCAEHGLYPLVPTYIPEEFKLVDLRERDSKMSMDITFCYGYKKQKILIEYSFNKLNDIVVTIPTNTHEVNQIEICGNKGSIIKEDKQIKLFFNNESIFMSFQTYDIEYDIAEKIVNSLEESTIGEKEND